MILFDSLFWDIISSIIDVTNDFLASIGKFCCGSIFIIAIAGSLVLILYSKKKRGG